MMQFNATFIVAMLSFIVFIMIMNAIFYNPILRIIRKRNDYISSNYEDVKRFDAEAKEDNDIYASKIEQTQDKCRHEIRSAIANAHEVSNSKIAEARQLCKTEIQKEKDKVIQESKLLKDTVKSTVVKDLASEIVTKLAGSGINTELTNVDSVNRIMD